VQHEDYRMTKKLKPQSKAWFAGGRGGEQGPKQLVTVIRHGYDATGIYTDIPLVAVVTGLVEVPDGTCDDDMQDAIATALLDGDYQRIVLESDTEELQDGLVRSGYQFDWVSSVKNKKESGS
jgi:hypothetical protein